MSNHFNSSWNYNSAKAHNSPEKDDFDDGESIISLNSDIYRNFDTIHSEFRPGGNAFLVQAEPKKEKAVKLTDKNRPHRSHHKKIESRRESGVKKEERKFADDNKTTCEKSSKTTERACEIQRLQNKEEIKVEEKFFYGSRTVKDELRREETFKQSSGAIKTNDQFQSAKDIERTETSKLDSNNKTGSPWYQPKESTKGSAKLAAKFAFQTTDEDKNHGKSETETIAKDISTKNKITWNNNLGEVKAELREKKIPFENKEFESAKIHNNFECNGKNDKGNYVDGRRSLNFNSESNDLSKGTRVFTPRKSSATRRRNNYKNKYSERPQFPRRDAENSYKNISSNGESKDIPVVYHEVNVFHMNVPYPGGHRHYPRSRGVQRMRYNDTQNSNTRSDKDEDNRNNHQGYSGQRRPFHNRHYHNTNNGRYEDHRNLNQNKINHESQQTNKNHALSNTQKESENVQVREDESKVIYKTIEDLLKITKVQCPLEKHIDVPVNNTSLKSPDKTKPASYHVVEVKKTKEQYPHTIHIDVTVNNTSLKSPDKTKPASHPAPENRGVRTILQNTVTHKMNCAKMPKPAELICNNTTTIKSTGKTSEIQNSSSFKSRLTSYGANMSDLIVGSEVAMKTFMSFYKKWVDIRKKTMLLFEELEKHLSAATNKSQKISDYIAMFDTGVKIAACVPHPKVSLAAKVISALTSVIGKKFDNSRKVKDVAANEFQLMMSLQQDIEATCDIYMYGLQCNLQFEETCKLIEEFHAHLQNGSFEGYDMVMSAFFKDISKLNPRNSHVFYLRLQRHYERLVNFQLSDTSKEFCRGFQDWPTAVSVIGSLHWRFHGGTTSSSEVLKAWEDIAELLQSGNTATINEVLKKVQNCILVLLKERSLIERHVSDFGKCV